jgi:hypothetical protein
MIRGSWKRRPVQSHVHSTRSGIMLDFLNAFPRLCQARLVQKAHITCRGANVGAQERLECREGGSACILRTRVNERCEDIHSLIRTYTLRRSYTPRSAPSLDRPYALRNMALAKCSLSAFSLISTCL